MKYNDLYGIISPLVTPFDQEGNINEHQFRKEINFLINAGVHGLSPGGSTGEGAALKTEEISKLVSITKEENKNNIPIVTGIIRNSTADAIDAGLAAKKAGANVLMVTPTCYTVLTPDDEGNYAFYKSISDEVDLPIIIYNVVPQNEISTQLFLKLLEIKNVIGIKQSVGGIQAMYDKVIYSNGKANIYAATDDMLYSCFDLGACGAIAAILTVFPAESVMIWNCVKNGDIKTAKEIQNMIYPVWQVIAGPQFPRRVKEALRLLGREVGLPRSPILSVTPIETEEIKKVLESIKLT